MDGWDEKNESFCVVCAWEEPENRKEEERLGKNCPIGEEGERANQRQRGEETDQSEQGKEEGERVRSGGKEEMGWGEPVGRFDPAVPTPKFDGFRPNFRRIESRT
nr:protein FAM9A-like [Malus domestica]